PQICGFCCAAHGMEGDMQKTRYSFGVGVDVGEARLDALAPERHQAPAHHLEAAPMVLRILADARQRIGRRHVPAAAPCGSGRSGGMPHALVIALTSEARRARPHLREWSRGPPPSGLIYGAAACIGTCAFKKRRTRSIVRCFSSAGSFHGYTVISAFGASEATSIEVCSGCPGTSSGSTSIGVWQCRMKSRDTLHRKSGCTA